MTPEHLPVEHYDDQLAEKVNRLTSMMVPFNAPDADVFRSPVSHYRMRAEFRIWHQGDDLYHIIFDQQTRQRIRVDSFPAASELINTMMPEEGVSLRVPVLISVLVSAALPASCGPLHLTGEKSLFHP